MFKLISALILSFFLISAPVAAEQKAPPFVVGDTVAVGSVCSGEAHSQLMAVAKKSGFDAVQEGFKYFVSVGKCAIPPVPVVAEVKAFKFEGVIDGMLVWSIDLGNNVFTLYVEPAASA